MQITCEKKKYKECKQNDLPREEASKEKPD